MIPLSDDDILQVTVRYLAAGQECLNVIHFAVSEITPDSDFNVVADELFGDYLNLDAGNLAGLMAAVMSEDVTLSWVDIQKVWATRYAYRRYDLSSAPGELVSPLVSPNMAWSITLQSDDAGPSGHGRKQIGGMAEESVSAGFIAGAVAGGPGDALAAWYPGPILLTTVPCTLTPIIFDRQAPGFSEVITHSTKRNNVRTMHRRTVGLGS